MATKQEATATPSNNKRSNTEGGELNTRMHTRRVWLVKVPTFLADAWTKPENHNQELGIVSIREEKKGNAEMSITLKGDYAVEIPKQYNLTYSSADTYTQIFSQSDAGAMSLEGNVEYRCDVRPVITEEYHNLMKGRVTKATVKNRYLQPIDSAEVLTNNPHGQYDIKRRKVSEKRERMGRDELVDELCSLFERQTYYDYNSLARATDQPQNWLKEVLNDICIYNKRGPHKGEYCLKPEYRAGGNADVEKDSGQSL